MGEIDKKSARFILDQLYYYFYNLYLEEKIDYYEWESFKAMKIDIKDWIERD